MKYFPNSSIDLALLLILILQVLCKTHCSSEFRRIGSPETLDLEDNGLREQKQLDLFHWLFGNIRSGVGHNTTKSSTNNILNANSTGGPQESGPIFIGPIQIDDIKNSTLKRVSLTPAFEKNLRDEIYKYNVQQDLKRRTGESNQDKLSGKIIQNRFARRVSLKEGDDPSLSGLHGSSNQILKRQGLIYPQQQLFLQQQAAAALQQQQQQQQQLLLLQNQGLGGIGRYNRRRRPYYGDYDDDSDSDEYDDFDSDEFMSFPIRAGLIPGIGGFRGRK